MLDPAKVNTGDLFTADYRILTDLLGKALLTEEATTNSTDASNNWELALSAQGLLAAARLLDGRYSLVITNVPYLSRGKQSDALMEYLENHYPDAKNDLANAFLDRCLELSKKNGGVVQIVMPQNWLFLTGYKRQRVGLLKAAKWNFLARLGEGGFESPQAAGAFTILLTQTNASPSIDTLLFGIDASLPKTAQEKNLALRDYAIQSVNQLAQLSNPDSRVSLSTLENHASLLSEHGDSFQGLVTGDLERFVTNFWEHQTLKSNGWESFRTTIDANDSPLAGVHHSILWESGDGRLAQYAAESRERLHDMHESGNRAWGRKGVAINRMRGLRVAHYFGERFDNNVAVVIPKKANTLGAIWCYLSSSDFFEHVRKLDTT